MRLFTLGFALLGATAITALPSVPDTGVSFTYNAIAIHPNSTLEERTGNHGGGGGGGKDHCKKERGRNPSSCQCYSGLSCHDDKSQCECEDQGNAVFSFCNTCQGDEPKCVCQGENQSQWICASFHSLRSLSTPSPSRAPLEVEYCVLTVIRV